MVKDWIVENKMKILWTSLEVVLVCLLGLFLGYTLGAYVQFKNPAHWDHVNGGYAILGIFILELLNLIALYFWFSSNPNKKLGVKRSKNTTYGDAKFLIDERNKKPNKNEIKALNDTYPNNCVGWVLKAKYDETNNKTNFNIANVDTFAHHLLVLGATRSGKTQLIVLLTIVANANVIEHDNIKKPSFVITDIKGEICRNTYQTLKDNGYEVLILNFKDSAHSNTWNPLYSINRSYIKANLIQKQIALSNDDNLKTQWRIDAEKEIDHADNTLREIAYLLFPNTDGKDAIWDVLAQSAFLCAYYYCLETFLEQYVNQVPFADINEQELYKLCDDINLPAVINALNNKEKLKQYISNISKMQDEKVQAHFMQKKSYETGVKVFLSPENTLGSAFANVDKATSNYANESIKKLITTNQIDLNKIADSDKPRAIYLIVAEGDEKSYKLLTMFINQLYSACIKKAESYSDNKLPRDLLLIMDEFCNMPKIAHASQFFTLGAGRRIMAMMIIQSITQLDDVYGQNVAKTLMDNCGTHIYIKSVDEKTNEYYSKWAGTYTGESTSVSKSDDHKSSNTTLKEMSLLTKEELLNNKNKDGYLIAFSMVNNVAYLKSNFFYQCHDLNQKQITNESNVVALNTTIVSKHLYNPFLFKQTELNNYKQAQELQKQKQEFLNLVNGYIAIYEEKFETAGPNKIESETTVKDSITQINNWINNKEVNYLYKPQLNDYIKDNKFKIYSFIFQNQNELNPLKQELWQGKFKGLNLSNQKVEQLNEITAIKENQNQVQEEKTAEKSDSENLKENEFSDFN